MGHVLASQIRIRRALRCSSFLAVAALAFGSAHGSTATTASSTPAKATNSTSSTHHSTSSKTVQDHGDFVLAFPDSVGHDSLVADLKRSKIFEQIVAGVNAAVALPRNIGIRFTNCDGVSDA